jgi:hypothetical protein
MTPGAKKRDRWDDIASPRWVSDFIRAFIVWQGAESTPAEQPTPNAASAGRECLDISVVLAALPLEVFSATYLVRAA